MPRAHSTLRWWKTLATHFVAHAKNDNNSSANLSHTRMLRPDESPLFQRAAALITPHLVEFGWHMFGERLGWSLKEMWVNVLDAGGRQAMHNHANSFISGVIYLTPTHPGSQTVFIKSPVASTSTSRTTIREPHPRNSTRTSGSVPHRSPATWCCSRAI